MYEYTDNALNEGNFWIDNERLTKFDEPLHGLLVLINLTQPSKPSKIVFSIKNFLTWHLQNFSSSSIS